MTNTANSSIQPCRSAALPPANLATLLEALEGQSGLSESRRRDLRSAVKRVAQLLGNAPAAVPLAMDTISDGLRSINPIAIGMTPKRFANIRSDFVAAVKASGLAPVKIESKAALSPEWRQLFARLSGRRANLGLSRLGHYVSAKGIQPEGVNDEIIDGLMAAVREGSLHQNPKALHRQVTLIWNEAARDPELGLNPVTVPSFRGPPKRVRSVAASALVRGGPGQLLVLVRGHRSFRRRRSSPTPGGPHLEAKPGSNPRCRNGLGQKWHLARKHPISRRSGHTEQFQEHFSTASRRCRRPAKILQLLPGESSRSHRAGVGQGRCFGPRRTQAAGKQAEGAEAEPDPQE